MAREAETLPVREVTSDGGNGRKRAYEGRSDGRICLRRNVRGPCELLLLLWPAGAAQRVRLYAFASLEGF